MYGFDAGHFYTASDPNMHLFVERGLRCDVAIISKRYAESDNPYFQNYDPKRANNYLMYLDANYLYGWAMIQPLTTHGFRWLKEEKINTLDVTSIH